ncbi:hypothetical protein QR680_018537 [Steinernema hermaphroditum]|uniref:C-type lectin domain-containing protein n=1 Tax=Steinernema hermaphroditum TaxID=289476 RepID=A0AA39HKI2_9BILA|nr:hypothetical protein QR680_018537 [Steinernema hermaphroditum]
MKSLLVLLFLNFFVFAFADDITVHCGDRTFPGGHQLMETKCKSGWRPFRDACYRLFYSSLKWAAAADFCALRGGHLVSIIDDKENDFVKELVVSVGQGISHWIGGFTSVHNADLLWTDGSPWEYMSPIETNSTNSPRRCAVANVVLATSIEWYMDHCDSEWPFICKKGKWKDSF